MIYMIINHNIPALKNLSQLRKSTNLVAKSLEKISSGLQINRSADNSAGLAISEKMNAQIKGLKQGQRNVMDGISAIQTAEGAMSQIHATLQRINELSVQAATGTLSSLDRQQIQLEIDELTDNIDQIAKDTQFNQTNIIGPPEDYEEIIAPVDLTFVIDKTDSMDTYAKSVADNLEKFVASIVGKGAMDVRISLVTYDDVNRIQEYDFALSKWVTVASDSSGTVTGSTTKRWASSSEYAAVSKALTTDFKTAGGTENVMETLSYVAKEMDFRDNAEKSQTKHIVLLTDERGSDLQGTNTAISNLKDKEIQVHGVSRPHFSEINSVVDSTGGSKVNIGKSDWSNDLVEHVGSQISNSVVVQEGYNELKLHVGANEGNNVLVKLFFMRTKELLIESLNVLNEAEAAKSITRVQNAIDHVSQKRAYLGSMQNRLESICNTTSNTEQNLVAGRSNLLDTDMAKEFVEYTKNKILEKSGTSLAAQANTQPEQLLKLLDTL